MTQPKPNHRPPGSAAPRLVDDLRDVELLSRVAKRTQRTRAPSLTPWIIAALAIAVAAYAIAKTQAGVGL